MQWTYDQYGNRLTQQVTAGSGPSNSVSVDPVTNRLNTTGYGYDAAGNLTNDALNALTYDAENRVVTNVQNGATSTYTYDGNSLRVKKVAGGTTTVYIFSGSKVIAEYDNGAAVTSPTRENIYAGSQLLATIAGGAATYVQADHLSARLVTDANGNVVGQQGHYPFGESWYGTGTTNTKWKFTSYERDAESSNDYAMMRYNVNRLGRFSAPDPIEGSPAAPQSLNRYSYTQNDPTNATDPLGLCSAVYQDIGVIVGERIVPVPVFIGYTPDCYFFGGGAPSPAASGDTGGGGAGCVIGPCGPPKLPPPPDCLKLKASHPSQFNFVQSNYQNAQFLAAFLNTSAANILGLSGYESRYGTSQVAQFAGNYFGLQYRFPGSGAPYTAPGGTVYSTYDTSNGFVNSGLSFGLSRQGSKVNGAGSPQEFAQSLLAPTGPGSYNSVNQNYMQTLLGAINLVQKILNCM